MRYLLFLFICALSFGSLTAQPVTGKQTYSLRECLDLAGKNNPDIKIANSQVSVSSADVASAFGDFLPSLRFNAGYSRQLNSESSGTMNIGNITIAIPKSDPNSYNMNASASLYIFNGFQRENNYSRAQNSLSASFLNSKYTRQKVNYLVYKQYIDIVRNMQVVKTMKDNFELGQKNLEKIKAQFEAGSIPVTDVYSQEADLGNKEMDIVKSENELNVAKTVLLSTMGLEPDMAVDFQETSIPSELKDYDIELFGKQVGSFESAVNESLKNRDDYQAIKYQILASRNNLTASGSSYYPSLSVSGGWSWSNSELNKFVELGRSFVGLNLSVPIFENFKTNYQIETAKLQVLQNEVQLYQLEQSIRTAMKTAFLTLESCKKQMEISERSYKSAEKNFEAVNEKLKVGSVNSSDYFLANNLFINAQINKITAVYAYIQAQKDVLYAMGKLE